MPLLRRASSSTGSPQRCWKSIFNPPASGAIAQLLGWFVTICDSDYPRSHDNFASRQWTARKRAICFGWNRAG
ncbi:hypothetical protein U0070_021483 [Myodes glareolus]|uniref:Uncharacterized protein n=1 Tax=Myodes glareolus TaxID=447135 RepID=A0AAW0JDB7_MYOGA